MYSHKKVKKDKKSKEDKKSKKGSGKEFANVKHWSKVPNINKLKEDIISDTSFNFQKVCLALLEGKREEHDTIDQNLVYSDAKDLYEVIFFFFLKFFQLIFRLKRRVKFFF